MDVSQNRGTPSHHPFQWDFPIINQPAIGYPHLWKPPVVIYTKYPLVN